MERLDAEIDRALKRLVQIKAMKELMNSANLQLYAPDVMPFSTLPTATSRTRKGAACSQLALLRGHGTTPPFNDRVLASPIELSLTAPPPEKKSGNCLKDRS